MMRKISSQSIPLILISLSATLLANCKDKLEPEIDHNNVGNSSTLDIDASPVGGMNMSDAKICIQDYWRKQNARDASLRISQSDAQLLVAEVADSIGLKALPEVIPCAQEEKAEAIEFQSDLEGSEGAASVKKGAYLIYNPSWMREVAGDSRDQIVAIFAHELGHIFNRDFGPDRSEVTVLQKEKDADSFAGCAIARKGLDLSQAEDLFNRLRAEKESSHPSRLESIAQVQAGFRACGGLADKICRLPENGIESWGRQEVKQGTSNWRGGGGDPDKYCNEYINSLRNGFSPDSVFDVVGKSEEKKSTCRPLNCPQYKYHCVVQILSDPIFKEARSPKCTSS